MRKRAVSQCASSAYLHIQHRATYLPAMQTCTWKIWALLQTSMNNGKVWFTTGLQVRNSMPTYFQINLSQYPNGWWWLWMHPMPLLLVYEHICLQSQKGIELKTCRQGISQNTSLLSIQAYEQLLWRMKVFYVQVFNSGKAMGCITGKSLEPHWSAAWWPCRHWERGMPWSALAFLWIVIDSSNDNYE